MKQFPFRPTLIDRLMVKHFRKALPKGQRRHFDSALSDLLVSEKQFLTDPVTNSQILFAATVLCLYRRLRRLGNTDEKARATLRHALCSLGRKTTAFFIRLTFAFARDPLQHIRKYSQDRMHNAYGPSFQIRESEIHGGFVSEVHVCGYRTFLARHHALDLASVLCEWDRVWIDALPDGIAFARPTTLATGGASCRFEFRRRE